MLGEDLRDITVEEHNHTALAKKSVLIGKTEAGSYVEVRVDSNGKLVISL
jgi:hypothetical protein